MAFAQSEKKLTNWRPAAEFADGLPPASVRELMRETGSLTRALRTLCSDQFKLRVIAERFDDKTESQVREVMMLCGVTPWVFAQSLIPAATLEQNNWISDLGDRPLGDTLFDHPAVKRQRLYFGLLDCSSDLYRRAVVGADLSQQPKKLWARRSVITIGDHELLVNEVFLPGAGRCLKA